MVDLFGEEVNQLDVPELDDWQLPPSSFPTITASDNNSWLLSQPTSQVEAEETPQQETSATTKAKHQTTSSGPAVNLKIHSFPSPNPYHRLAYGRLGTIIGIQAKPFDPQTYDGSDLEPISRRNEYEELEERAAPNSMIRWRWETVGGKRIRRSNAKLVRWNDGSNVLYVGNECFHLNEKQLPSTHFLCAQDVDGFQIQRKFDTQFVFQPAILKPAQIHNVREKTPQLIHKTHVTSVESLDAQIEIQEQRFKLRMQAQQAMQSARLKSQQSNSAAEFSSHFLEEDISGSHEHRPSHSSSGGSAGAKGYSRGSGKQSFDSIEQEQRNAQRLVSVKSGKSNQYGEYMEEDDDFVAPEDEDMVYGDEDEY